MRWLFFSIFVILTVALIVVKPENLKEPSYQPFCLADVLLGTTDIQQLTKEIKEKLIQADFSIIGEYSPYDTNRIIIISNTLLKDIAQTTQFGAYAAVVRVAITLVGDKVQISYSNPLYTAHVYRLSSDLSPLAKSLQNLLGHKQTYGADQPLSKTQLRNYHYMQSMPFFTDYQVLAEYSSQDQALRQLEKGFARYHQDIVKIYQLTLSKNIALIGFSVLRGDVSDQRIMRKLDIKAIRSAAHLPYELLVKDGSIYALDARFRIAISFPSIPMGGEHSFMKILSVPNVLYHLLKKVSNPVG